MSIGPHCSCSNLCLCVCVREIFGNIWKYSNTSLPEAVNWKPHYTQPHCITTHWMLKQLKYSAVRNPSILMTSFSVWFSPDSAVVVSAVRLDRTDSVLSPFPRLDEWFRWVWSARVQSASLLHGVLFTRDRSLSPARLGQWKRRSLCDLF